MNIKSLYIAIIGFLTLMLPGCTDSPESPMRNPEKYITFASPQLDFSFSEGAFTRAELVGEIKEFYVWGYCIPCNTGNQLNYNNAKENWQTKSEFFTSGPDVLQGHKVTVDGSTTSYDKDNAVGGSSNPRKWYEGDTYVNWNNYNYGFIAASAASGTFEMTNSTIPGEAHPVLKFTLDRSGVDLTQELNPSDQPDALIGTKFDQRKNSTVSLNFKHIMTGLRFRFHNQTTNSTLTIHKVTFEGKFYRSCDFSFVNEEWMGTVNADDTYSGTFVLLDKDQTIAGGSSDLMRHDGNPLNSSVKLLLLPNPNATLTPSEDEVDDWALGRSKKISIEYSIDGGDHKTYETGTDFKLSYIPDPNTLHTANFHFTGNDFVITFVPDNNSMWYDGSNSNLEIH